ncbi:UvrD-helicase domain-containing protein [Fannyhessea vaginae]|uniref:UvrD-helicase domain-containing protein n=1 Tax=Fannyhessea vaginae TaxID=82135 RepID=UPI003B2148FC
MKTSGVLTDEKILKGLNDQQKQIVTTLASPLFVEAGAGSGKTFTLTKRVLWALTKGSGPNGTAFLDDVSQVLIITFTHAAAHEIKERIRSSLREAHMVQQALEVDNAWISTIHGMCSRILKTYALDLGIDPQFSIASENDTVKLMRRAVQDVLSDYYHKRFEISGMRLLLGAYEMGSMGDVSTGFLPTGLCDVISTISRQAKIHPHGYDDFTKVEDATLEPRIDDIISGLTTLCNVDDITEKAKEKLAPCTEFASRLKSCFQNLNHTLEIGTSDDEVIASSNDICACLQELRTKLPTSVGKAHAQELKTLKEDLACAHDSVRFLVLNRAFDLCVDIAQHVDERYMQLKRECSMLDNDDLIHETLRVIKHNSNVAEQLANRFKLVMVDEFQDTDTAQLELISLLSGKNAEHLTTVGDAQQSIYAFRGADVSVFRKREATCTNSLKLCVNYRSHKDILSFVDKVCDAGTPSNPKQGLVQHFMHLDDNPQRDACAYKAHDLPRLDVEMVKAPFKRDVCARKVLAAALAQRMYTYVKHGQKPSDMALLVRSATNVDVYLDAIRARGLNCVVSGGSTFTSAPEVQVMAQLLHVLANPCDTQNGLFGLLISPLFALDEQDLLLLASMNQPTSDLPAKRPIDRGLEHMTFYKDMPCSLRLQRAHDILMRARNELPYKSVADVCLEVVKQSGWLLRLETAGTETIPVRANIMAALKYIDELTKDLGLGPARAAQEFDIWLSRSKIAPASLAGDNQDSIQVMTVHASKGLEFPLVFLSEWYTEVPAAPRVMCVSVPKSSTKQPTHADAHSSSLDAQETAAKVACMLVPPSSDLMPHQKFDEGVVEEHAPVCYSEWFEYGKRLASLRDREESARILYVGLTRAREALIVGLPLVSVKDGYRDTLALRVAQALDIADEQAGLHHKAYGGSQDASVRVFELQPDDTDTLVIRGNHALEELEGYKIPLKRELVNSLSLPVSEAFSTKHDKKQDSPCTDTLKIQDERMHTSSLPFELYDTNSSQKTYGIIMQRASADFYSFSSIKDTMDQDKQAFTSHVDPQKADAVSVQTESMNASDTTRATALGSAFHQLAQSMVESHNLFPSDEHIARMCAYWKLSAAKEKRLRDALCRWWNSNIRREVLTYDTIRAEVPFCIQRNSVYGRYYHGAFDLLATSASSRHALLIDYKTGDLGLSKEEIAARHALQSQLYADVLLHAGYTSVTCAFVCVELDDGHGQPYVIKTDYSSCEAKNPTC